MANSNGWGDGAANNSIGWGQGANNAIAWGDSHAKSWAGATDIVGIDSASSEFFTATGITGATQQTAIDNLVKGLKSDGLWSKMKAVYPFVTDNRNLLSYTEDFTNGFWIKNNLTVTTNSTTAPNGTTTADTLSDNLVNNFHYINTGSSIGNNGNNTLSIYAKANTLNYLYLYFYNGSEAEGATAWFNLSSGTIGTVQSGLTASIENAGNGWYRCSITRNFNFTANNSNCGFGVSNADNVGSYLGTNKSLFVWGAQLDAAATATTYQPIATTQQAFISSQFKYNLVNPVDSDAAFRLVFNGGWTHSANGATPNGTNGYADTKLNPSANLTINNSHASFYSRTNNNSDSWDLGSGNGNVTAFLLTLRLNSLNQQLGFISGLYPTNVAASTQTTSNAFGLMSRTSSTLLKLYRNATLLNTNTAASSTVSSQNIYIGGNNDLSFQSYSARQCAFSTIGDGLTDTEAANLYTRVQAFQTALNRQV